MRPLAALSFILAVTPLAAQGSGKPYDYEASPYFKSKQVFTAPRLPNGECDWRRIPITPQPKGYSSMLGPADAKTCTGTIFHMKFPPSTEMMRTDTAIWVAPHVWTGPDTLTGRGRQARDVVNALRPKLAPTDSVISVTFSGDATARVETKRRNGGATYTLYKKQGKWVVSDTSTLKVYRNAGTNTKQMLPEALTRADSLAIRKAARAFLNNTADTSAAFARFGIRGDSVFVPTWADPKHIAMTTVRVVRREGRWIAVSNEGLAIQ